MFGFIFNILFVSFIIFNNNACFNYNYEFTYIIKKNKLPIFCLKYSTTKIKKRQFIKFNNTSITKF